MNIEAQALVLADAVVLGDKAAARKWGCSERSVRRFRQAMGKDPELTALVRGHMAEAQHDLAVLRVSFLRDALVAMKNKFADASLEEIASAMKVVGELHQVAMAVGDERPDSPDQDAAETAADPAGATH